MTEVVGQSSCFNQIRIYRVFLEIIVFKIYT